MASARSTCSDLLEVAVSYTSEDYRVSELESFYLELAADAARLSSPSSKQEKNIETFLLKKASFLNDISIYIYRMKLMAANKQTPKLSLAKVSNMLLSLGIHPQTFGVVRDEQGALGFAKPQKVETATTTSAESVTAVTQSRARIGFEHPEIEYKNSDAQEESESTGIGFIISKRTDAELPSGQKRRIGFLRTEMREEEAPARRGGSLKISKSDNFITITDLENLTVLRVSSELLAMSGAETSSKRMKLDYDNVEQEWIIGFENLTNPSGRIGF